MAEQLTDADYAISTLAEELAQALAQKAIYLGKLTVAERTMHLLARENADLRERLDSEKTIVGEDVNGK